MVDFFYISVSIYIHSKKGIPMFIVNKEHYHFETEEDINRELLDDCYFYETRLQVLTHMKEYLDLCEDEICDSYLVSRESENSTKVINDRGFVSIEEESLEDFVQNYQE